MEFAISSLSEIPVSSIHFTELPQKKTINIREFLYGPSSDRQLKRPSLTQNSGFNRKLSTLPDLNSRLDLNEKSNIYHQVDQLAVTSKRDLISPTNSNSSPQRPKAVSVYKKNDYSKKNVLATAHMPSTTRGALLENIMKTFSRAKSVSSIDKDSILACANSTSKDPSLSDIKNEEKDPQTRLSLRITVQGAKKEFKLEQRNGVASLHNSRPRQTKNENFRRSYFQKEFSQNKMKTERQGNPNIVSLSNVIRRKSCHCSDCGGLSNFEKRHLNVAGLPIRVEINLQKNIEQRKLQDSSTQAEKETALNPPKTTLRPTSHLASGSAVNNNKILKIDSNTFILSLDKDLKVQKRSITLEQAEGSNSFVNLHSPKISSTFLKEKNKHILQDSINLSDETIDKEKEKDYSSQKDFVIRKNIDSQKALQKIGLRLETENNTKHIPTNSPAELQKDIKAFRQSVNLGFRNFEKSLLLLPSSNKALGKVMTIQIPNRQNETIKNMHLPSLDRPWKSKKALTARKKSKEKSIKEIYGLSSRLESEEKSPQHQLSSYKTSRNYFTLQTEAPVKAEGIFPPTVKKRNHPARHKNLSLQIKKINKDEKLPLENPKPKGGDSIEYTKIAKTERDLPPKQEKSRKSPTFLRTTLNAECSEKSNIKFRSPKFNKIKLQNSLIRVYRKTENS